MTGEGVETAVKDEAGNHVAGCSRLSRMFTNAMNLLRTTASLL